MEIDTISPVNRRTTDRAFGSDVLTGADFLQLLVTQLTNQDPLEPTTNADLLQQLSSIRDIELTTTLVDSLKSLTGSQRYASAAALIGKHVTGRTGDQSAGLQAASGTVVGVRFDADGKVSLELDSGVQLPLELVETVSSPQRAAESLIGTLVRGVSSADDQEAELIEGIVTAVRSDDRGDVMLELDTGEELRLRDLVQAVEGRSVAGGWPIALEVGDSNSCRFVSPTAEAMGHPRGAVVRSDAADDARMALEHCTRTVPVRGGDSSLRTARPEYHEHGSHQRDYHRIHRNPNQSDCRGCDR